MQIGPCELPPRLNGTNYANFLSDDLPDLLEDVTLELRRDMMFQQDGAPPHFSNRARRVLNEKFPNSWIGRGGPRNWPPRSPDLSPLDYFLWGLIKEFVYRDTVDTRMQLEEKLMESLGTITPEMLRSACANLIKRAQLCIEMEGGHFEHLL